MSIEQAFFASSSVLALNVIALFLIVTLRGLRIKEPNVRMGIRDEPATANLKVVLAILERYLQ